MRAAAIKTCPDCAEDIRWKARVCPHCAFRFERKPSGVAKFALSNATVMVSLIGATAFFATWLCQTVFYSKFGVEPADVGLTYTETLTRAAAALIMVGGIALLLWQGIRRVPRAHRLPAPARILVTVALVVGLIALVAVNYWDKANDVKDENALTPKGITLGLVRNPLGLRVERVRVSWIDEADKDSYEFGMRVVMYLGRASGVAVFYDPDEHRTVRVPDTGIVIERAD